MSAVPPTPRVKLRTATRRVPRTRNAETDASVIPDAEPNIRLSRAILVMLLLHVVAVGGILAFSLIKERGHNHAAANPASNALEAEDSDAPPAKVENSDADHAANDVGGTLANTRPAHSGDTLTRVSNDPGAVASTPGGANDAAMRIAGGHTNVASSPATPNAPAGDKNAHLPPDSGKTYVVQKGESPYTIAEKLKLDASALLKLNGIDDPKKLKPGQILHVPVTNHAKTK